MVSTRLCSNASGASEDSLLLLNSELGSGILALSSLDGEDLLEASAKERQGRKRGQQSPSVVRYGESTHSLRTFSNDAGEEVKQFSIRSRKISRVQS